MHINPNYFDGKGRWRWGDVGYPTCAVWHPRYLEDELFHYLAVGYSDGGGIKLFFVHTEDPTKPWLELVHIFPMETDCHCLAWGSDGVKLVAGGGMSNKHFGRELDRLGGIEYRLRCFDVTTNREDTGFDGKGHTGNIESVAFSPDGKTIVSGSLDYSLRLWDAKTGMQISKSDEELCMRHREIYTVSFSPDGNSIASKSNDHIFRIWDARNLDLVSEINGLAEGIFSSDGKTIISASRDDGLQFWNAETGVQVAGFMGKEGPDRMALSPDGRMLAYYYRNPIPIIQLWDIQNGSPVQGFDGKGHTDPIYSVAFSPDGKLIVSVSRKTIRLWDSKSGIQVSDFYGMGHTESVQSVAYRPDGRAVVSGSVFGTLWLWDAKTGTPTPGFGGKGHTGNIESVTFGPDGRYIASGGWDKMLQLWDAKTGTPAPGFDGKGHTGDIESVTFSPDGRNIASGGRDNMLRLWDAKTGTPTPGFDGRFESPKHISTSIRSVTFRPDGKRIVSGSNDTVRMWDTQRGRLVPDFAGIWGQFDVHPVSFSPNGRSIVLAKYTYHTGVKSKVLSLWDVDRKSELPGFEPAEAYLTICCAFSPNGKNIVTAIAHSSFALQLWDAKNRTPIPEFDGKGHNNNVNSVTFSPDGRYIISGSEDGTLILWSLAKILGPAWLEEHMATPLILTPVWFPERSLCYMEETKQGNVVRDLPLARCGECGQVFPIKENQLDKEIRCPMNNEMGETCNRLLKINPFIAGERD